MNKEQIVALFLAKGILSKKSGLVRRVFCWKKKLDAKALEVFNEFAQQYRTDDEAWFCLCRNIELPICPVCHKKKVKFTGITKNGANGYNTVCEDCSANAVDAKIQKVKHTCSKRTAEDRKRIAQKRRQTNKLKYGDETYNLFGSNSFKSTLVSKYGNESFNNREKAKNTCIQRYGVTTNLLIEETHKKAIENSWSNTCREKRIANSLKKYGVANRLSIKEVIDQCQKTKRENIHTIEKDNDCTLLADVVKKYGQGFKTLKLDYLRFGSNVFVQNTDLTQIAKYAAEGSHTNGYVSNIEKEVLQYVRSICNYDIEENTIAEVPNENHKFFELDIYIPQIRLAIDINGTYWHSTKFKDKYYHQRKTRCCNKVGIQLLHIFEDEWKQNNDICKKTIQQCIDMTYANVLSINGDIIVGDNSKPIFGNIEILKITKPLKHIVGNCTYYDGGNVYYIKQGKTKT